MSNTEINTSGHTDPWVVLRLPVVLSKYITVHTDTFLS